MLTHLKRHRSVSGVLCYKIDRLARNMRDYAALDEMGWVAVISATESLPENATGKLVGTILAASSRWFSDQLSERVKLAMRTKAKGGVWPSMAPFGYLNDSLTRGILPDKERAPQVVELFQRYAEGDVSLSGLVKHAHETGIRTKNGATWQKSPLHKLLTNPLYAGLIRWGGMTYPGTHEPLVSRELFERVQRRLDGKSHPQTKRFPLPWPPCLRVLRLPDHGRPGQGEVPVLPLHEREGEVRSTLGEGGPFGAETRLGGGQDPSLPGRGRPPVDAPPRREGTEAREPGEASRRSAERARNSRPQAGSAVRGQAGWEDPRGEMA